MSKKNAALSLKVPEELKAELERLSELDGRTVNNFVNRILAEYLKGLKDVEKS